MAAPTLARYHRNVDSMPLGGVILGGQPASCKTDTSNSLRGAAPVKLFAPVSHYVGRYFGSRVGGLIHAAVAGFGGCGETPNGFGLAE